MKIMLISPLSTSHEKIKKHLEDRSHVIVYESPNIANLVYHLAKYRPHVIFASRPDEKIVAATEGLLAAHQLDISICWIPSDLAEENVISHLDRMVASLAVSNSTKPIQAYAPDARTVIMDVAYEKLAGASKQNVPGLDEPAPIHLPVEMLVFARHVEAAMKCHALAKNYLRQVLVTDKGIRTEIAYRAVHSSHKVYWLREHIFRWVGVLAHYLPGVEPEYLPPPAPPSAKLDFLHHVSPRESFYAATALLVHGFKPSWVDSLKSILAFQFTGQDEVSLLRETLILSGWSTLLREIATAHVRVMDCALHCEQPWYGDSLPSRSLHRATGIYCDFWHLRHLRTSPHYLRLIANDVVIDGLRTPDTSAVVPSFRHYFEGSNGENF